MTYAYDKNGNEIGQTNGKTGEILYRTYDAENRLTEVSVNKDGKNAIVQQNRYNGDGQRIQRVEGDQTTNYYYQDGVVSYTTDGKGEQTSQDLLGTDGNIIGTQRYTGNDAAYYVYNKDDSIRNFPFVFGERLYLYDVGKALDIHKDVYEFRHEG